MEPTGQSSRVSSLSDIRLIPSSATESSTESCEKSFSCSRDGSKWNSQRWNDTLRDDIE